MTGGDDRLPPMSGSGDAEDREEIEFHLEQRALEFERAGMVPEAARHAAREAFGDPELVAERMRDARRRSAPRRRATTMETVAWDLKLVVRSLRRRPMLAGVVVLTLGLGIGAVTAVFGVVDASVLRDPPLADPQGLVFLQGAYDAPEGPQVRGGSPAEVRDWGALSNTFDGVAAFDGVGFTLTGTEGDAERLSGETVDRGYFEITRVTPLSGRTFTADEYEPGAAQTPVLIGEGLWTRRFGRQPGIEGRSLVLNGRSFTVVGVLPASFTGVTLQAEVWVPLAGVLDEASMAARGARWLGAVGRLRPGVSLEAATADVDRVAALLEERFPDTNRDRIALVMPVREVYLGSTRTLMLLILGATGVLLVIAAINVANLLLVKTWAGYPELLVRQALGSGRLRLAAQLVWESLLLSATGSALGFAVGSWGARALAGALPPDLLPAYAQVEPDIAVFGLVVGIMTVVGLATGLVPAFLAWRADLSSGLRPRGGGGGAGERLGLQRVLIVSEVALALLLLVGAGLMARSLRAQLAVSPGFDAERLLVFRVELPPDRYPDAESRRVAADELLQGLAAGPGVSAATLSSDAPLRGQSSASILLLDDGDAERVRFYHHTVGRDFFEVMGIGLEGGSGFDASAAPDAAIISRAMAERLFGSGNPIGRSFRVGGPEGLELTILGVADDVRWRDLTTDLVSGPTDPDVYIPFLRFPDSGFEVLVRTPGDPATLVPWVRQAVSRFDPDLPLVEVQPMTEVLRTQTAQGRFGALLLGGFSAMAALLAAVGLYGVLSFMVGRRSREIAVRMALGAEPSRVRRLVLRQGLVLAGIGLAIGIAVSWQVSETLDSFLFGVRPVDPPTYAAVAGLLVGVTLLASWIPASRATRVEPQAALSAE